VLVGAETGRTRPIKEVLELLTVAVVVVVDMIFGAAQAAPAS
jgi:hypothetical protein